MVIHLETASRLLDFGARIGPGQRADEQLEGAVAIHNVLMQRGVAYLADEVGMGKTYVALGAMALMRHFNPDLRVLVIAPKENIQRKWMKELRNFVAQNVRFPDLRVKAIDGRPVRPLVCCDNLEELAREAALGPDRDFFVRLSSFSLAVPSGRGRPTDEVDPDAARRLRDGLRKALPWLPAEVFDLRSRQRFKDNVARALCCALPVFDLVIVDEGHNLKHGYGSHVAARNRVLALALGRDEEPTDPRLFPGYGPRARHVLFLSATPVEETYRHLWNQLDVFGKGAPYRGLLSTEEEEASLKQIARQFLIRRVTNISVGGVERTKNQYRREWRNGGVLTHDEPIRDDDPRRRLVVALVQKKVSELLGHERFNTSFQVGMLASFESFLETTGLKGANQDDSVFDDAEQTDDSLWLQGLDVAHIDKLSSSYRRCFGTELPHPKMDALVNGLSNAWASGRKALVFVRRVASVAELKRKLEERYDLWLMSRLREALPPAVLPQMERVFQQYQRERQQRRTSPHHVARHADSELPSIEVDRGGTDTFFSWFFRGDGPPGVVSGANVQQRFVQRSSAYATFFEDNHLSALLECRPRDVMDRLVTATGMDDDAIRREIGERSRRFLTRAKRSTRADRFEAAQAAAFELLKDCEGPWQEQARIIWHERFEGSTVLQHASDAPELQDILATETFFTRLRERTTLRAALWPDERGSTLREAFRERELRRQLFSTAARLGHASIDLYALVVGRLGSLDPGAFERQEPDGPDAIDALLDLLDVQQRTPRLERKWGAFDELADIAENFDLLLDTNEPEARTKPLSQTARIFGVLLGEQQPVGGMSGKLNSTLVRQFRMPGYPLVLVTTDLLQEGEDLHTFCSEVFHYGIAWTPSSMEQRIGRIDRVRSHTERRLLSVNNGPDVPGEAMLQVYFPHLQDTVEVLQVDRVLGRMSEFLRLMHDGLLVPHMHEPAIDTGRELVRGRRRPEPIKERLCTAFPVRPEHLRAPRRELACDEQQVAALLARFRRLAIEPCPHMRITWEPEVEPGVLHATAAIGTRIQPFTLLIRSQGGMPSLRCVSPIGRIMPVDNPERIIATASLNPVRIGAIVTAEQRTYDLTVEDEVLFPDDARFDAVRIAALIRRVASRADALEREYLSGADQPLSTFKQDMDKEAARGR